MQLSDFNYLTIMKCISRYSKYYKHIRILQIVADISHTHTHTNTSNFRLVILHLEIFLTLEAIVFILHFLKSPRTKTIAILQTLKFKFNI